MQVEVEKFDEDKEWENREDDNHDSYMDCELDAIHRQIDEEDLEEDEEEEEEEVWLIDPREYPTTFFDIMFPPIYHNDESSCKLSDFEIMDMAREIMHNRRNDIPIIEGADKCLSDALHRYISVTCLKPSITSPFSW